MFSRNRTWAPAFAALALLVAGRAQAAVVIDNFEQGAFAFVAPPPVPASGSQPQIQNVNCVAADRQVDLLSNGGTITTDASAQLQLGQPDDEVAMVMPEDGGKLILEYEPTSPADLTAGGTLGRIDAYFTVSVAGGILTIEIEDDTAATNSAFIGLGGPGTYSILLSSYATLDLTRVVRIRVTLDAVEGDYHLADIRVRGEDDQPQKHDAADDTPTGPPYPTLPTGTSVITDDMDPMPLGTRDLLLHAAEDSETAQQIMTQAMAEDSGNGTGMFGRVGQLSWSWIPGEGAFPATTFFDVFFQATAPASKRFQLCGSPTLLLASPETFVVGYEMSCETKSGDVEGQLVEVLQFDIGPGQPLWFFDVTVPPEPCEPFFHTRLSLQMNGGAAAMGGPEPDVPLFTVTMMGDFTGQSPVGLETPGALDASGRFLARPSVMRAMTQLRFDGQLDNVAPIVLYDVAGRAVRALRLSPGAALATWDGRDEAGRDAAPGVYLARLGLGDRPLTTRIVKLR